MRLITGLLTLLSINVSINIWASQWDIIPEQSSITFHGTNSGSAFDGTFKSWNGNIEFDPNNLASSVAFIYVDLTSVETNNKTYNTTLATSEWFDLKSFPKAVYKTTSFIKDNTKPNHYTVNGTLDIKNISIPVVMDAEIIINGNTASLNGKAVVNRLNFDLGKKPDPDGKWVSAQIPLDIKVQAKKL